LQELRQALLVLGVPPGVSIGREAADLDAVMVRLPWLRANLIELCGQRERASAATGSLMLRWRGVAGEDTAPVGKVTEWLAAIPVRRKQDDEAQVLQKNVEVSPEPQLQQSDSSGPPRRRRRLRGLGRLPGALRWIMHGNRDEHALDALLEQPLHDISSCPVCTNTFFAHQVAEMQSGTATTASGSARETASSPARSVETSVLTPGVVVCLHGLQGAAHLNGLIGTCAQQIDSIGGLWAVELETGEVKSVGQENLVVVGFGQTRTRSGNSVDHFGPKVALEPSGSLVQEGVAPDSLEHAPSAPLFIASTGDDIEPGEPTLDEDPDPDAPISPTEIVRSDTADPIPRVPQASGVMSTLLGDNSFAVLPPPASGFGPPLRGDYSPALLSPRDDFQPAMRGDNSPAVVSPRGNGFGSAMRGDNSPPMTSPAATGFGVAMQGDSSPPSISPAELFIDQDLSDQSDHTGDAHSI